MRRERTGHEAVALLVASLLHGGLLALEPLPPPEAPAPHRSEPTNELEIGLWEREELPATEPSDIRRAEHTPANQELPSAPAVSRRATPAAALDSDELGKELSAPNQLGDVTPAGDQEDSAPDPGRPMDLGIGPNAWKRWAAHAQPGEPRPRAPGRSRRPLIRVPTVSSSGGLQEGLEQHDRELGLSPAGSIVSALYRAALSESPRASEAVFAVTISRTGSVEVELVHSATSGREWQLVAQRAATSLREKLPRIPSARNGVRVVLKLLTEEVLPSGRKVEERKGVGALLPWLGDPADLGAKSQKVIRTRVQEEAMF